MALKDSKAIARAEAEGKVTRAKYLGSVMFTSQSFYKNQADYLAEILELMAILDSFLDERHGSQAPTFRQFRDNIQEIQRLVVRFLNEKAGNGFGEGDYEEEEMEGDASGAETRSDSGKQRPAFLSIRNRAEAYRMLTEAADYLLIHEPHSPTPYLVKRAVAWGHMSLTELLHGTGHGSRRSTTNSGPAWLEKDGPVIF